MFVVQPSPRQNPVRPVPPRPAGRWGTLALALGAGLAAALLAFLLVRGRMASGASAPAAGLCRGRRPGHPQPDAVDGTPAPSPHRAALGSAGWIHRGSRGFGWQSRSPFDNGRESHHRAVCGRARLSALWAWPLPSHRLSAPSRWRWTRLTAWRNSRIPATMWTFWRRMNRAAVQQRRERCFKT